MQIHVPIYVQQRRRRASAPSVVARPLFFTHPTTSGNELGRVIAKLANRLRVELSELARKPQHDELLCWHHPEPVQDQLAKLFLDLRLSTAELRVLLVSLHRHGRIFTFSPSLPDLWFEAANGQLIQQRATEVYQSYFRQQRKEFPDYPVDSYSIEGKAWIDHLTIDVLPQRQAKPPADPLRAMLGGEDVSDGAAQLRQVGRCLNWVDADDLTRPIGMAADVKRLIHLLDVGDRRGIVLVGPSGSGKTARIEGAVLQRRKRRRSATHGLVWHLSPARLISGMSYLGQWQERVLAILRHAFRLDHVLYFDDMLGLYEAGKTRDSAMCVADTLRAQLDIRPVRILAEMTHEAWAILRERDRAMADRFIVLPTEALGKQESMKILVGVRSRLEAQRRCRFDLGVLPEVVSMYDRFDRSSVLPGKAAAALARLAAQSHQSRITREDAVNEFQSRSGLRPSIIDRQVEISRETVTARIRQQVVGQDDAVNQLVDRVLVAAARLNDTTRPLGTFLLVGPTGVGKTQLAKAVGSCLFEEGGLIRLDMNELSSPSSAARLVGTFDAPDGLLTSAIRRRPHAVLLLDEIEKAHPTVLDVLLQALGEARLSDARGRTVDLSGLLILMTSNLGSRESGRGRGFASSEDHEAIAAVHDRAVREFFRPEFFNRIDSVLSFDRLSPESLESIAWMQFREILRRDGLQRRSVLIDIDPDAIRQTAERGFDPTMGARALKRQIERDLVGPAAELLAATSTDQPTLLRLAMRDGEVDTSWQEVEYAQRLFESSEATIPELCQLADSYLASVAGEVDDRPIRFEVGAGPVDPKLLETMTLRDTLHACQDSLRALRDAQQRPRLQRPQSTPVAKPAAAWRYEPKFRTGLRDVQALDDIQDFLRDSLVPLAPGELDGSRDQLIDQLARLHQQCRAKGTSDRWLVWIRWYGEEANPRLGAMAGVLGNHLALSIAIKRWARDVEELMHETMDVEGFQVECFSGALAMSSLQELCGGWMCVDSNGDLSLADVSICAVDPEQPLPQQLHRWQHQRSSQPIAPVRRILQTGGSQIDLVTGAVVKGTISEDSIVELLKMSRRRIDFLLQTPEVPS